MSQIKKKFIKFDTTTTGVNAQVIPANFTPSNYTPVAVSTEGTDKVSSNLKGIDTALSTFSLSTTGDINLTSFTFADNQSSVANVTGLTFSNAVVRSFSAQVGITRADGTYAQYTIDGIQKASSWVITPVYVGDSTGITFSITSAGQIQYTSSSTGFGGTMKFRARVISI